MKASELTAHSCGMADFGALRAVSKACRICFQLTPLVEVELKYIEHKYASYFEKLRKPVY